MKKKKVTRSELDIDTNYVAPKPTHILTATHGTVTVVTKLYGEVTPERIETEQRITMHRAEQLDPVPKRQEHFERDPVHREPGVYIGEDEARDMVHRAQNGQPFE